MKDYKITKFINELAGAEWFTALHYRIVLFLIDNKATQAQISRALNVKAPNVNKVCKELISESVICISEVNGRNKTLTTNINWSNKQIKGQVSIDNYLKHC